MSSDREAERLDFLKSAGLAEARRTPLAGDASTRAYERLTTADGRPLKAALQAAQARAKRRAFLLVLPLLVFVLLTFLIPIGYMLKRSFEHDGFAASAPALVAWFDAGLAGSALAAWAAPDGPLTGWLVVLFVIPAAFLWTHLVALALAVLALALRGVRLAWRVPPDRLAGSVGLFGRTAVAAWAVGQPGLWLKCAGWPWLAWAALQAAAWLALRLWPARPEVPAPAPDLPPSR